MRIRQAVALVAVLSAIWACNFPVATATPVPTDTPTGPTPFASPAPSTESSPGSTPRVTPSTPEVTPVAANVNCRSGPDVAYSAVSVLVLGDTTQVAGRNADSSWWYVHDPSDPGAFCWISAGVVTISGPLGGIPLVAAPAPIVTQVTANAEVSSTVHCGEPNTVMFSGTITTNGAATVKYQWEITGDKSNTTPPQTLDFAEAGTKDAQDPGPYTADCGHYTVTLRVLSPNDTRASKNFKIEAP